jgi:hypothetical protein
MEQDYRLRRSCLAGLYLLAATSGLMQGLIPETGIPEYLISILFCVEATGWCVIDSRILGHPLLPVLRLIIFLTWPFSVPIYLVWSRGMRGVGLACLHAVGLMFTCWLVFWLSLSLTE